MVPVSHLASRILLSLWFWKRVRRPLCPNPFWLQPLTPPSMQTDLPPPDHQQRQITVTTCYSTQIRYTLLHTMLFIYEIICMTFHVFIVNLYWESMIIVPWFPRMPWCTPHVCTRWAAMCSSCIIISPCTWPTTSRCTSTEDESGRVSKRNMHGQIVMDHTV